ncbi:oxygen-independent coproporphyrinogen III oxidase [Acetobacter sp. TBRC 12305]|uniref:Coproporphyrinogen-III oxidase n=1 Tax=Acetobacter garciniae TaxID=2817435 RepID=A0A939HH63_9PROT|nr:oxygen-independent coproporphyrinogen III oxidase [Acetobacter garciniae]MBO1324320.1 oxygen-independent coproporphyrinogen III oxidase [Acetobacter garciniae]MBX0344009.1 oxygen-independent coproporphyrinogen III oxidase [Acetobacter garciniae]
MSAASLPDLVLRYGGNLPRYTSYPTAASFTDAVGPAQMEGWLKDLPRSGPVSLYFHVPFCDELCRFCGCNTSVMRHDEGRQAYGDLLREEMRRMVALAGEGLPVGHVQFGGGTPTTLPPAALRRIMRAVRRFFHLGADAELSMELDPRHLSDGYAPLLGELGFNRVSLGVQDLDPQVQEACGRHQSFEQTRSCITQVRNAGIAGVNIDLIYGLPYQTAESVAVTAARIADLGPDRLAVFGYAHVPWKQKRQRTMPVKALPGPMRRLEQRARIDQVLRAAGYVAVGLDHYARPGDALARAAQAGTLHRNFQGYTTDSCDVLLGMGASAISMLPQGFAQNVTSASAYARAMAGHAALPVARGIARTPEDLLRGAIIERIMCDMGVDLARIVPPAGMAAPDFTAELQALAPFVQDGLATVEGQRIVVTDRGRPFLRNVAALFDTHRAGLMAQAGQADSPAHGRESRAAAGRGPAAESGDAAAQAVPTPRFSSTL